MQLSYEKDEKKVLGKKCKSLKFSLINPEMNKFASVHAPKTRLKPRNQNDNGYGQRPQHQGSRRFYVSGE